VAKLRLTPRRLALAALIFGLADWGEARAGGSFVPGGPLDETAHLLTMLIVLWALPPRMRQRFGVPALAASVLIDVDHMPQYLGFRFLTQGTPRPYPHSLLTLAVVLLLALAWKRRRDLFLAIALGLVIHFWRDLSESGSGVALLWPLTNRSFNLSQGSYLAVMAAVVAVDAWKCRPRRVDQRALSLADGISR
jgi:inner membrane protein